MKEPLGFKSGEGSLSRWNEKVARSDGSRGGGGSQAAASAAFLVLI
jgi:hypothetical protein